MSYEQLLHDFVDGSLDYQGETVLFSELHSNEDLRSELKMLIAMGRSAAHDIDAFVPAPESRDAILRRLGFSSATRTPPAMPGRGFLRGSFQGIFGGVIGALLMALAMFGLDIRLPADAGTSRTASPAAAHPAQSGATGTPASAGPAAGSPGKSFAHDPATRQGVTASAPATEPVQQTAIASGRRPAQQRSRQENGSGTVAHIPTHSVTAATPRRAEMPRGESSSSDTEPLSRRDALPLPEFPPAFESAGSALPPVSIEYRQTSSRSFAPRPASLANPSEGLLRDRSLGAYYRLGEYESIGVEAGQEEFYQSFEEMLPNGDFLLHQQNPVLFWGGASYRLSLPAASDLRPFAEAFAGGTRVGPIGRIAVGASYAIAPEIELFASGELKTLAYSYGGNWYFTPKYGMSYGVRMNF